MIDTDAAQKHINKIQALFREWIQLESKLNAANADWQRSMEIMEILSQFYFGDEYQDYIQAIENGEEIPVHTEGEYSVLSEDALWNAFHEQQNLAWQRLRTALQVLDKYRENS